MGMFGKIGGIVWEGLCMKIVKEVEARTTDGRMDQSFCRDADECTGELTHVLHLLSHAHWTIRLFFAF
jgi:hypothetical protein